MSGVAASVTSRTPPTRLHHEPRDVGGDEHPTAIAAVGDDAAGEREDEEGHELRGDHEPDRLDAAAGLEHGEGQRHEHDAVADERQHLARRTAAGTGPRCAAPPGRARQSSPSRPSLWHALVAIALAGHMPVARKRRRITGWDVSVLVAANAVVVVGLWWRQGGIREIHDLAGLLTSLGRVTGLLGALPGPRRAAAAGAHPGARRGRARADRAAGIGSTASRASRCCSPTPCSSPPATRSTTASR